MHVPARLQSSPSADKNVIDKARFQRRTPQDAEPMEILILCHKETAIGPCKLPDPLVGRPAKTKLADMQ